MADGSHFYQYHDQGEFQGNLLKAVAALFPQEMAERFDSTPPVICQWRVFEAITWDGRWLHGFHTDRRACDAVQSICELIYYGHHKPRGNPYFFIKETEGERFPAVDVCPSCCDCNFTVWQPGFVEVPEMPLFFMSRWEVLAIARSFAAMLTEGRITPKWLGTQLLVLAALTERVDLDLAQEIVEILAPLDRQARQAVAEVISAAHQSGFHLVDLETTASSLGNVKAIESMAKCHLRAQAGAAVLRPLLETLDKPVK
jgi:hypothetical protein